MQEKNSLKVLPLFLLLAFFLPFYQIIIGTIQEKKNHVISLSFYSSSNWKNINNGTFFKNQKEEITTFYQDKNFSNDKKISVNLNLHDNLDKGNTFLTSILAYIN